MKRLVHKMLRRTIGAPTLWLGLGVAMLCASLALSYLRAQVEADYALMLRVGLPEAVPVAEAVPAAGGEGHLLAGFDAERAVPVGLPDGDAMARWLAVPLFAAESDAPVQEGPTRPRARPDAVQDPQPVSAIALFAADGPGPEALLEDGFRIFNGALNGPLRSSDAFGPEARTALASAGFTLADRFVVIEPWIEGRAAALAPPPESAMPQYLFWFGVLSVLAYIGLSLWPEEQDRYLDMRSDETERNIVTRSRIKSDAHRFNPLIGQDEIRRGAMERLAAAERAQGRTPSTFHTNGPAAKVGGGWVKNRR